MAMTTNGVMINMMNAFVLSMGTSYIASSCASDTDNTYCNKIFVEL